MFKNKHLWLVILAALAAAVEAAQKSKEPTT